MPFRARSVMLSILVVCGTSGDMTKHIEGVSPRVGQRGTTVAVQIVGISIHEPREIIFFRPGIHAFELQTAEPPHRRGLAHGGLITEAVSCKFKIAPDCEPGEYAFRLLTAAEMSGIATFHVSPFPVVAEKERGRHENDSLATAEPVSGNTSVLGKLGDSRETEVDLYRVAGKAGQRLSAEAESARIADVHYGGSEYDLALRILDSEGRELAANDDNAQHIQDPILSLILPQDGSFYVELKRSVFVPANSAYCLHIGSYRRPLVAFPPGGPVGSTQPIQMIGDPAGTYDEPVRIPMNPGTFANFADAPSPVMLRASTFPNVLEDPPADETLIATLPAAANGIIDSRDDSDRYRFHCKKDERLRLRVFSASLGSPLDPRIQIRAVGADGLPGKIVLEADDARLTERGYFGHSFRSGGGKKDVLDPSVIWTAEADGDYLLEISDSSGSGGPTGVYRIEIEPPPTMVQTALTSRTHDWTESMRVSGMIIPQGNRWTVNISLPRAQWDALDAEYELVAHGLPTGLSLVCPAIKPGTSFWPLQFRAAPAAKLGGAVITLEAKLANGERITTRSQQNVPFINHSGGDAWRAVHVDRYIIGVTDPAPFSLNIEPPKVALVRGGELAIPVRIFRQPGFEEPVEFSLGFVGGAVDSQPPTTIPAGESSGMLRLTARPNAPLGTIPLVVIGGTLHPTIDPYLGAGQIRVSSEIVNLTVSEPYVEFSAAPTSLRRGESGRFVWAVQHKSPFVGDARVKLLGLPKGVTVVPPAPLLAPDATEVAFTLAAATEALLGQVNGLTCEVTIPVTGQEITQRTGRGSLRIDPE
ncbi:MAG: hypothetical protein ACI8W8_004884, partial [Rhodothermales bacterium]